MKTYAKINETGRLDMPAVIQHVASATEAIKQ